MASLPQQSIQPMDHAPRRNQDPIARRRTYGAIRPMDSDLTWWERFIGR